jgi:hypothetical protein
MGETSVLSPCLAPILCSYEASPWGRRSYYVVCLAARMAASKTGSKSMKTHECEKAKKAHTAGHSS